MRFLEPGAVITLCIKKLGVEWSSHGVFILGYLKGALYNHKGSLFKNGRRQKEEKASKIREGEGTVLCLEGGKIGRAHRHVVSQEKLK